MSRDLKELLNQLERYVRLEAVDKLTVVMTCIIVCAMVFAFATSAIFFISTGVVKSLTLLTGNEMLSYYLVGFVLMALVGVAYMFRKPLVENRVVRVLSQSLLEGTSITDTVAERSERATDLQNLAKSLAEELDEYDEEGGDR